MPVGKCGCARSRATLGTGHRMNARDMVVRSASLALDRVRAFIEIVDQY